MNCQCIGYSAVILCMARIICMSMLHQWGTLNKTSPASLTASMGLNAGCTGVVQCHTAPATLSPALSGTHTQQGPALESLQGNLLYWVSCGDSSLAIVKWKLPVLKAPFSHFVGCFRRSLPGFWALLYMLQGASLLLSARCCICAEIPAPVPHSLQHGGFLRTLDRHPFSK